MRTCTLFSFFPAFILYFLLSISVSYAQPTIIQSCTLSPYEVNDHAFYLNSLPGDSTTDYVFDSLGGHIDFYSDSTARITGRIVNMLDSSRQWDADIWLIHPRTYAEWTALGRSVKNGSGSTFADQQDWVFYEMDNSRATLVGAPGFHFDGDSLFLKHRPANYKFAVQYGFGANDKNGNFGLSGWFDFDGSYDGKGDINVNVACDTLPPPPTCSIEIDTFYASCKTDSTFEMVVSFSGLGSDFQITDDQGSAAVTGLSPGTYTYGEYFNSTDVMLTIQDTSVANCIDGTPPVTADCTPVPVCNLELDSVYTECLTDTTFGVVLSFTGGELYTIADDQGSTPLDSLPAGTYSYGSYPQGTDVSLTISDVFLFSCVEYIGPLSDSCSSDTSRAGSQTLPTPPDSTVRAVVGPVFPNPIQGQSKVLIHASEPDMTFSYLLVDGASRVWKQGEQDLEEGDQYVVLDFEQLNPGLYFLKLVVDDEILSAQRIIVYK